MIIVRGGRVRHCSAVIRELSLVGCVKVKLRIHKVSYLLHRLLLLIVQSHCDLLILSLVESLEHIREAVFEAASTH